MSHSGSLRRHPSILIALFAFCLVASSAMAVQKQPNVPDDFDAAGGPRIGLPAGAVPTASQLSALGALESFSGGPVRVVYNGTTRVPRSVIGHRPLSPPSADPAEVIALRFIRANAAIWKLSDSDIAGLVPNATYTDRHNGVSHVYYTQMAHGLPVFPASFSVHLTARGQVIAVTGDVIPGLGAPTAFAITPDRAAQLAAANIGVTYVPTRTGTEGDAVVLAPGPLRDSVKVSRSIYASLGDARAAYRMILHKNGQEWFEFLVHGTTGEVLYRRNLFQFLIGALTPSAPVEADPTGVKGLVYVEHPMATVRGTGDLFRKYSTTTDPRGNQRGIASSPLNGSDAPATTNGGIIPQTLLALPDFTAPVRSTSYPLATSPQSPQGWFIPTAGKYLSIGNNVDAKDDVADNDEGTAGIRADGGATGNFTGGSLVYTNRYGQGQAAAGDIPAAVMTMFYLSNWYHDMLYHLGFTEAAGNFQKDNFGRGGLGNDYLLADGQDGSGVNNANFGTPPDGSNPRMQMYLFTTPNRDGTMDGDVIIHEYSHGLSNRLVGGPNNVSCLGNAAGSFGLNESGGMGEGWGDWMAAMTYDEPTMGEYATGNNTSGIRFYAMNDGHIDWTYQALCTGAPTDPNPLGCQVHETGTFWSIVLWEMRESMINRFHNRTYPNKFPTFVPQTPATINAAGNIRMAQGRTVDGSGSAAQIDRPSIEQATFTAMFEVVDAMKLAPCQPTIPDMRDAILLADRNLTGGEFQDVIWRAMANRGLGALAESSGSNTLAKVGDFSVPANVAACETAGGPLAAPSFTAVAGPDGTATITVTNNGAASYVLTSTKNAPGSPVDPEPFVTIATKTPDAGASTIFNVTGLSGGTTYYFRVRALRNADCVSGSNVESVVGVGAFVCDIDPVFGGLTRAVDLGDCERVALEWLPATPGCPGATVSYNVYRSDVAGFTPAAANRVATGITTTSHFDAPGALNKLYHYIVRAIDTSGNEDDNLVKQPAVVTSLTMRNSGFLDNVETGADNTHSPQFTSSGLTVPNNPRRGGFFRDNAPAPATARSGTTVWHTFNSDNQPVGGTQGVVYELRSNVITVTPSSILTFWHTYQFEGGFDGGVIEVATANATTGTQVGLFEDLGGRVFENPYSGVLSSKVEGIANTNPLADRAAWTGGNVGPMRRTRVFLGGLVPTGSTSQAIIVRFLFGCDVANAAEPTADGDFLPGWYIDDISVDEPCCPTAVGPTNLVRTVSAGQVDLSWTAPASGTVTNYIVLREQFDDAVPSQFSTVLATIPGTQTTFSDTTVASGTQYAYVVRAVLSTGCGTRDSNIVTSVSVPVAGIFEIGANASVSESGGSIAVNVNRTGGSAGVVGVSYSTSSGSADAGDFTATSGTLTFADGDTQETITIPVTTDTLDELDETFTVSLSSPTGGATIANPSATTITITDDDIAGVLQVGSTTFSVDEAGTLATIVVTRTGGAASGVTVNYATSSGTATAGEDFTAASGTLTFDANETAKSFTVQITNDSADEDNETFNITLSNPGGGAVLGTSSATATIVDDDSPITGPFIDVVNPASVCAGRGDFTLTVDGGNFVSGAVVLVNGSARDTTFVSANRLTAMIRASDVATAGAPSITVVNPDAATSPGETLTVTADTAAPAATAPAPITVLQTTCNASAVPGVSGSSSSEMAAFLVGGSALDGCSPTTTRLSPQAASQDVNNSTLFRAGTTTVTFRFRDNSGNIGEATSSVTVRLLGDLDVSDSVASMDTVILANNLVGNIAAGTAPFTATPAAADLNSDGNIDVIDLVLLLNHLVGNTACLSSN